MTTGAMTTSVKIHITEATDSLLTFYPSQQEPQDAYMELDLRTGEADLGWNGEIGNAVPMDVWHGIRRRYTFSDVPRTDIANALLRQATPLMERVLEGSEVVWDGNNHVARLSEDAEAAESEIEALCAIDDEDAVKWWDALEWLYDDRDQITQRLQAGETIDALYDEFQGDGSSEDAPYLRALREYLEHLTEA